MAFHEVRFPDDIAYGATGGPEFATSVVVTASGFEQRNINWSSARGRWDVASGLKKQTQLDALIAFFRARKGRAHGFRFKDWTDYKATAQALGTGNGTNKTFQLVRTYSSGGGTDGLTQALSQQIVELYTPDCRAELGDARCKVNLAALTVTGAVTEVSDRRGFTDTSRAEADGYWIGGLVTWTSGANTGRKMEVKAFASGAFTLFLPMPSEISVGDTYSLIPGCDKKFATCKAKYSNVKNFRGEPNVPGNDQVLAYPDAK